MKKWTLRGLTGAYVAFVATVCGAAELMTDFAYGINVTVNANQLYEFELTDTIYRYVRHERLADLRIFDAHGNTVPYNIIHPAATVTTTVRREEALVLFPVKNTEADLQQDLDVRIERNTKGIIVNVKNDERADGKSPLTYYIADMGENADATVRSLLFDWQHGQQAVANVIIFTSGNLRDWRPIGSGPVFHLLQNNHLFAHNQITVNGISRYLKIMSNDESEIVLNCVKAVYETRNHEDTPYQWTTVEPTIIKNNLFRYTLATGFPVHALTITPRSDNTIQHLMVRSGPNTETMSPQYAGNIFRLKVGDKVYQPDTIVLRQVFHHPVWEIEVLRANKPNIEPPVLMMGWRPQRVRFLSSDAGSYTVAIGSASVTHFGPQIPEAIRADHSSAISIALTNDIVPLSGEEAIKTRAPVPYKKYFLWLVLIAVLLVMSYMSARLVRHMRQPGHDDQ
ncbi:MAG: DUF3999 domain-containing protein [Gammaproteobacteria bacterium]|nr:DUF3999 domain-containing protein [Gammaproteobacteria bacterium]